jgi:hypothetical protein
MGFGAKGAIKQYRTCIDCRTRTTQKKNPKKRPLELEDNEVIEELDLYDLYDYIIQLLNMHTMQIENKENMLPFCFECQVDISTLSNNSEKEVADILIEYIEDADEFAWM